MIRFDQCTLGTILFFKKGQRLLEAEQGRSRFQLNSAFPVRAACREHLFLYYCIKIRLILKCPAFEYPFSWSKKKKTAFLQQNDKYGWIMLR
jgi:hypothetical protein